MDYKKSISPVIATALLLIVAVVSVVAFQGWFSTYTTQLFSKVETQSISSSENIKIDQVVGTTLYFKNAGTNSITLSRVTVDGIDCNVIVNVNQSSIAEIDIAICLASVSSSMPEVVVYTNQGIYSQKIYLKSQIVLSSCNLNGTTISQGSNYTFYNSSIVPYGSSCSGQVRSCNNGNLNGSSNYNVSSCSVLSLNCSALGLAGGTWITVPGNSNLGTSDFCVMKFEAKNNSNIATSQAALTPWININQINSRSFCAALGSKYHLITNAEWTTIARNAESVSSNWNTSIVGSGYMFLGHQDNNPSSVLSVSNVNDYYDQTLDNSTNCDGSYFNFGASDDVTTGKACLGQKRIFILNNSEIIWDLSGNAYEWNNDTCSIGDPWYNGGSWYEWTNANINTVEKDLAGPLGNYTASSNGVGMYAGCASAGSGFIRGGTFSSGVYGGIYFLALNYGNTSTATYLSYRCAYTP